MRMRPPFCDLLKGMKNLIHFTVRMAELLVEVHCQYESTREYCRDYLLEAGIVPDRVITISEEILEEEQRSLRMKDDPGAENRNVVENYSLCRALAEYLPERNRVLFHGSSLAVDGQGVLFTAKSGTGKSTHTRLWREVFGERVVMVNDDKPFLHIETEGTTIYGNPWRGKHRLGSNMAAPLRAICIVCRGEENRILRLTPREALPTLLQQTYMPEDPQMLRQTLALTDRLSKTVPVYRLYCNMDPQAARVAYAGLELDEKKVGAL